MVTVVAAGLVAWSVAHAASGESLEQLSKSIKEERQAHPVAFQMLERIRSKTANEAPTPHNRVGTANAIIGMGPDALLPILELLAFQNERVRAMNEGSRVAFTVGMLEALTRLKDARAGVVLVDLLNGNEQNAFVSDAAARALGALCRTEDIKYLEAASVSGHRRETSALKGLGYCRKQAAADVLVGRLESATDEATVNAAAIGLGWMGSSWGWRALGVERETEGNAIRAFIADALMRAWLNRPGATRKELGDALMMTEHPGTEAQLEMLTADGVAITAAELEELRARWSMARKRSERRPR